MPIAQLESYFRGQQVSLQWLPMLRALATEMAQHTSTEDLRFLFFKVGQRFAGDTGDFFESVQSLTELEDGLNDFWMRINWGWIELKEEEEHIEIAHYACPLAEAFGDEALPWSVGLLEGFYESVFHVLGASDDIVVREVKDASNGMHVVLRFGRAVENH
jgi:hypothetical protein